MMAQGTKLRLRLRRRREGPARDLTGHVRCAHLDGHNTSLGRARTEPTKRTDGYRWWWVALRLSVWAGRGARETGRTRARGNSPCTYTDADADAAQPRGVDGQKERREHCRNRARASWQRSSWRRPGPTSGLAHACPPATVDSALPDRRSPRLPAAFPATGLGCAHVNSILPNRRVGRRTAARRSSSGGPPLHARLRFPFVSSGLRHVATPTSACKLRERVNDEVFGLFSSMSPRCLNID